MVENLLIIWRKVVNTYTKVHIYRKDVYDCMYSLVNCLTICIYSDCLGALRYWDISAVTSPHRWCTFFYLVSANHVTEIGVGHVWWLISLLPLTLMNWHWICLHIISNLLQPVSCVLSYTAICVWQTGSHVHTVFWTIQSLRFIPLFPRHLLSSSPSLKGRECFSEGRKPLLQWRAETHIFSFGERKRWMEEFFLQCRTEACWKEEKGRIAPTA